MGQTMQVELDMESCEGQTLPSPQDYSMEENLARSSQAGKASDRSTDQTSMA